MGFPGSWISGEDKVLSALDKIKLFELRKFCGSIRRQILTTKVVQVFVLYKTSLPYLGLAAVFLTGLGFKLHQAQQKSFIGQAFCDSLTGLLFVFTPEGRQMKGSAQNIYLLFNIFCVHLVLVGVVYQLCDLL